MTKQPIISLLEKWLDGSIRTEERKALADLLEDVSNRVVIESMMDEELLQELYAETGRQEQMLNSLHQTLDAANILTARPIHRIHFLKTTWFRYAAAVILVFGAAAYFWSTNKKPEQTLISGNKRLQTDVAPGR